MPESFEREVTASEDEFERDLGRAWPSMVRAEANRYVLRDGDVCLEIVTRPIGVRRLGLLELRRLAVRYRFESGDEAARRFFLMRLDRAMQRGGG